ncbi:MAG: CpeS-like protein [Cyanobacteria bacterium K_DeepCast_35m_m2_023]|nr:CpeS-like protein [Cyanobacteria bacterium K_DeepCast_35m_m2_023]
MSDTQSAGETAFPPATIKDFLQFCAGEWMSLRSQMSLGISGDDDSWHSSERGELVVQHLEAPLADGPGGIRVGPKADGTPQEPRNLHFAADGSFRSEADGSGSWAGRWTLWPDGSLELVVSVAGAELHEKIWFTKPNLRLRSTVEHRSDGVPGRASFSSEIRRVSRPA